MYKNMSEITRNNWKEFIVRSILFILTIISYIIEKTSENKIFSNIVYFLILLFFMFKMVRRLVPHKIESMGNQKIFKRNYMSTGENAKKDYKSVIIVGLVWISLNLVWGIFYFKNIFDDKIMMIISMLYSVCDLICVLIYCPFQRWFMKNKCCNTCRIYNWDFAMMFTPLIFVPSVYNYSLVLLSLLVLVVWEYNYNVNTNRFHEKSNKNLRCSNCKELMCKNKLRKIG